MFCCCCENKEDGEEMHEDNATVRTNNHRCSYSHDRESQQLMQPSHATFPKEDHRKCNEERPIENVSTAIIPKDSKVSCLSSATTTSNNSLSSISSSPAEHLPESTGPSSALSMDKTVTKPGYAWIFNHVIFDNPNTKERVGSDEDVKSLLETFEYYQLETTVIQDAKAKRVKEVVKQIETKDYSDHACIVIVILSHGTRHEEIAAKDGHYSIDDHVLYPILRNASLKDKPKLFFIQACKGSMKSSDYYTDFKPWCSPNEILKCYSTFEGFVSYRTKQGSIFIQTLCKNLKQFGSTENIKDIMDIVIQSVKQESNLYQHPDETLYIWRLREILKVIAS